MKPLRFLVAENPEAKRRDRPNGKTNGLSPDVIVMDISMPRLNGNGLKTTRQKTRGPSGANVLILTVHESEALVRHVLNARARGHLLKTGAASDLLKALNALRHDPALLAPGVTEMALERHREKNGKAGNATATNHLTPRQRQILQLLAEGNTSRQAGLALGLSIKTVETHRSHIMTRLNCHSISELVRYAIRNHVIDA